MVTDQLRGKFDKIYSLMYTAEHEVLNRVISERGVPDCPRSDNEPEIGQDDCRQPASGDCASAPHAPKAHQGCAA